MESTLDYVKDQWTDMGTYEGQVLKQGRSKEFVIEGQGKVVLKYPGKKTVTYEGEFKSDRKHGEGKQVSIDDDGNLLEVIIGSWADGYPHGFCLHRKPDGSEYEGLFRRGKREGFGKEVK